MPDRSARRRALLALALVALALLGGGPGAAVPRAGAAPRGVGELYLALGDSLGVGLLSSAPEARGYVAQFHGLLEQSAGRPVALRNLSVSGETARSMIVGGQLLAAQDALAEAGRNGWRVSPITIDIGGNDMRALQGADERAREAGLAEFRANIARIFDTLVTATTRNGTRTADIVTMTVYNPYGGDPAVVRSDAWWVARFNVAIAEEARKRDIAVAEVYERFRGREKELTYVPLDFHANNRGHRAIAEEFWRAAGYDTTAPTVEIVAPAAGSLPRAVPTIKVRAGDNLGVARVEFLLDDRPLPEPVYHRDLDLWIGYWDARAAPPGPHRLTIVVTDAAGNATRREATVSR
jgi:lysophospholipase L1-like esterase